MQCHKQGRCQGAPSPMARGRLVVMRTWRVASTTHAETHEGGEIYKKKKERKKCKLKAVASQRVRDNL